MKAVVLGAMTLACSTLTLAANPLSVHILNQETGLPSANVSVVLEAQNGDKWLKLNEAKTDENGRIKAFYPTETPLQKGVYKVTFKTGEFYKTNNQRTFFPEIPVVFTVDGSLDHYHIPLLLSSYGYSTYRGN